MIHGCGPDGRHRITESQVSITQNNWDIQSTRPQGLRYPNFVESAGHFQVQSLDVPSDVKRSTARTSNVQKVPGPECSAV
jgi:hypothetical protein